MKNNPVWGLTGSIATGKSTILKYIEENSNIKIIQADHIGHDVLKIPEIIDSVVQEFGEDILTDGAINRRTLGKLVFSDKSKLQNLNSIVQPEIRKLLRNKIEELAQDNPVIVEMAILIEMSWQDEFDKIILVTCDSDIQFKRLLNRGRYSTAEAMSRIDNQLSPSETNQYADFLIDTTNEFESYEEEIKNIIKKLTK